MARPNFPEVPDLDTLKPDDWAALAALDAAGRPAGPGEDFTAYRNRLLARQQAEHELYAALEFEPTVELFGEVRVSAEDRIPREIVAEAAEITEPLYGFAVPDFPGFFLSHDVGALWGGCLISDTELPLAIFLIRENFREKERFFIYNRRELLAHELCHSARQELHDVMLEEFFAYQTSPSRLRRYLGNCFIRQRDALCFVIPSLLLLIMQLIQSFVWERLPVWPFWIAALGYPAWLLIRNAASRHGYFKACRRLAAFGVAHPAAVLFRVTAQERAEIGRLADPAAWAAYVKARTEIRWQVIRYRFLQSLS